MNLTFKLPLLACLTAIVLSACNQPAKEPAAETKTVDMAKLKTDIQAMEDAFAAGEKAKDVNAVAAYYADDATSYPRERAPQVGIAAIKDGIAKNLASDTAGEYNVYKVVDLFAEGNMAVEIGSWTRMNRDGKEAGNGHYLSYFQNRDGKWVCVRDMSVSSNPKEAMKKAE